MTDPPAAWSEDSGQTLEMSEVENRPVALRNRSIIEGSGPNQTEQGIGG
jgi:hypothetical protein